MEMRKKYLPHTVPTEEEVEAARQRLDSHSYTQRAMCETNLIMIEEAKDIWALRNEAKAGDTCTMEELVNSGALKAYRECPAGGVYNIGKIGEKPRCSIHGKL